MAKSEDPVQFSSQPYRALDDEHIVQCNEDEVTIREAFKTVEELKKEGNDYFRAKKWDEALATYRSAVGHLPNQKDRGKGKGRAGASADALLEDDGAALPPKDADENSTSEEPEALKPPSELEKECAKTRAVLNANIGACYVKLEDHKEAVKSCTQALADDPAYIKALQRRAVSNEALNTWSSLTSAQEDYTTILTLLPQDSAQAQETKRALQRVKPRTEAAQKQETAEMMDKLKGFGNGILGRFGLSTDNFKFEPNGQGGYSMNFTQ